MKLTSAQANKAIKRLQEDKEFYLNKERSSSTYVASIEEEPVVPDYDFEEVYDAISVIDEKIATIKHAINLANATTTLTIELTGEQLTVDTVLIRMAQLNKRKAILDKMRKAEPKERINEMYGSRKSVAEYKYINYNLDTVKRYYDTVSEILMQMQLALDKYNQTTEFEVEINL